MQHSDWILTGAFGQLDRRLADLLKQPDYDMMQEFIWRKSDRTMDDTFTPHRDMGALRVTEISMQI